MQNHFAKFSFVVAFVVVCGAITAVIIQSAKTDSLAYEAVSIATESQWLEYARNYVKNLGITGNVTHEEWALMTVGSYLTLVKGFNAAALPRDKPIFIYEAFGDVPVLTGFGSAAGSTDIVGFTVIFDGETSLVMNESAYPESLPAELALGLDLSFIPVDAGESDSVGVPPPPTMVMLLSLTPPEATGEPMP